jgi:flagellar hook-associated protein 1 FlgK
MSNWFAGINQASTGLDAARYGLSVVGQNMTNADTPGYTRQVADQASVDMGAVRGIFAGPGALGGVTVTGTTRQTDPVLDARVRGEHARGSLADTTATQLQAVEGVFPEPSDDGLGGQLNQFWSDWGAVANDPGSTAARSVLLKDAGTVAGTLNSMSASLSDVVTSTAGHLSTDVAAVNSAAQRLAQLNGQIAVATATGADPNSLLDQRDQLLQNLSELTGATVTVQPNGAADVAIGGQSLVSGVTASAMTVDASYGVQLGGTAVTVGSGSIGAETTALTTTLPGYQSRLDAVADGLSAAVNSVQAAGYDLAGAAGTPMFGGSGAAGITVVLTNPAAVAAAGTPGGNLDGSNALAAADTGAAADSPDARYAALVGDVAAASALAQQRATTQDAVVSNVDSLKSSVSGVSLDEEAASMLTYQQAFNASSRVLTALDSMLDTLINHTGLVGLQ